MKVQTKHKAKTTATINVMNASDEMSSAVLADSALDKVTGGSIFLSTLSHMLRSMNTTQATVAQDLK
jgi:hypothetical protein